jgi:hypothetical protein
MESRCFVLSESPGAGSFAQSKDFAGRGRVTSDETVTGCESIADQKNTASAT